MSFIIGEMKEKTSRAPDIEPGAYMGVFSQLIGLGTHYNKPFSGKGEGTYRKRLRVGFEIPELLADDGKPIIQGRTFYNTNLGTDAKPTDWAKFARAWHGKEFSQSLDLTKKLGSCSTLIFAIKRKEDGEEKLILDSASPLRSGAKHPVPVHPAVIFQPTVEAFENDLPNLPDWLQDIIKSSVEYRLSIGKDLAQIYAEDGYKQAEKATKPAPAQADPLDDDVPF